MFPTWCAGCDAPDVVVCSSCREALAPRVVRREVAGLPVYAGVVFDGAPARIVRACKEEGRTGLARALAPALAAAAGAALAHAPGASGASGASGGPVLVVAVPTTAAAMRRRGYRVVELLASRADLHPQRLLRATGRTADQRALGVADRARNMVGAFHVSARLRSRLEGRTVLLVDDVVTTGATLAEAARTLREAGAEVIAAATVASTPRIRTHSRRTTDAPAIPT